jgi:putative acetyltransferase
VSIRPERPDDAAAIRALHDAAFGGTDEGRIVDGVRGTDAWLADLSLVAVDDATGEIVGHVLVSRGRVERPGSPDRAILILGPIGVRLDRQRQGVGAALMRRAIELATAHDEPAIVLLGHASYYPRFGFQRARPVGLEAPAAWPDEAWMVLRLPAWTRALRGTVRFPAPFGPL